MYNLCLHVYIYYILYTYYDFGQTWFDTRDCDSLGSPRISLSRIRTQKIAGPSKLCLFQFQSAKAHESLQVAVWTWLSLNVTVPTEAW